MGHQPDGLARRGGCPPEQYVIRRLRFLRGSIEFRREVVPTPTPRVSPGVIALHKRTQRCLSTAQTALYGDTKLPRHAPPPAQAYGGPRRHTACAPASSAAGWPLATPFLTVTLRQYPLVKAHGSCDRRCFMGFWLHKKCASRSSAGTHENDAWQAFPRTECLCDMGACHHGKLRRSMQDPCPHPVPDGTVVPGAGCRCIHATSSAVMESSYGPYFSACALLCRPASMVHLAAWFRDNASLLAVGRQRLPLNRLAATSRQTVPTNATTECACKYAAGGSRLSLGSGLVAHRLHRTSLCILRRQGS